MNFQVTETGINLRVGRLILFYAIEPHCIGIRWWEPERSPLRDRDWIKFFGKEGTLAAKKCPKCGATMKKGHKC